MSKRTAENKKKYSEQSLCCNSASVHQVGLSSKATQATGQILLRPGQDRVKMATWRLFTRQPLRGSACLCVCLYVCSSLNTASLCDRPRYLQPTENGTHESSLIRFASAPAGRRAHKRSPRRQHQSIAETGINHKGNGRGLSVYTTPSWLKQDAAWALKC